LANLVRLGLPPVRLEVEDFRQVLSMVVSVTSRCAVKLKTERLD